MSMLPSQFSDKRFVYGGAILLGVILIVGFVVVRGGAKSSDVTAAPTIEEPTVVQAYTHPMSAGVNQYKSLIFSFSIMIPSSMKVYEYDDGTSATTITFEETEGRKFQIFVVPYAEEYVTEEQFKKDLPSGTMREPIDIIIDGTPAKMFFSTIEGVEMREVWFIRNGFLYEITTQRENDEWLSGVMKEWKFI